MNELIERKIIINELLINYYYNNSKNSKTILFLHGWRSESKVWFSLINALLLKEYSIYVMDIPGFGKSDLSTIPFDVEAYSNIVKDFILKLNLKNVILVGHSHGGRIAIKLASQDKLLVKTLVLVDSSGIIINKFNLKKVFAKIVSPIFKPNIMKPLRKRIYQLMGSEDYVETPRLKETFLKLINEDLTMVLNNIKIPTLVIWGENDKSTPLEMGQIIHKNISNSSLKIINNAGHYPFIDKPKEFKKILLNFITINN